MQNKNYVFIACSLDGYIADKDGGIDFLHSVPNPDNLDMGYNAFNERIDAIVMGRNTFEVVLGFDIPWPYSKPVYVVSSSLKTLTDDLNGKVDYGFALMGSEPQFMRWIELLFACYWQKAESAF